MKIPFDAKIIGTVGRFHPVKGQIYLLKAFRLVLSNFPNTFLIMVGRGKCENYLQAQIQELQIQDRIRVISFRQNIKEILSLLDVFVLPSLSEGFPISIVEAMAMKKPIIASNVGGVSEIVLNNTTGILVPPANAMALADSISYLLGHREIRNTMGQKAYESINGGLTLQDTVRELQELYLKVLNKT